MSGFNWELTPEQASARFFADDPVPENDRQDSNDDLLEMLVAVYRREKRPPRQPDLPTKRSTIARRFGGWPAARELAYARLTPAEQAEYKWRCPHCLRDNFVSAKGLASHVRVCIGGGGG